MQHVESTVSNSQSFISEQLQRRQVKPNVETFQQLHGLNTSLILWVSLLLILIGYPLVSPWKLVFVELISNVLGVFCFFLKKEP